MSASVSAFGFGFDFFLRNMKEYRVRLQACRLFHRADMLRAVRPNGNSYAYNAVVIGLGV